MGFFRSGFFGLACLLLFTSFFAMNLFLTMSSSLTYENVQREVPPLVNALASEDSGLLSGLNLGGIDVNQLADKTKTIMDKYCKDHTEYTFTFEGRTISVPCSSVQNGSSTASVVNETTKSIIEDIYYKQYDCNFWSCLTQDKFPYFLISQKAQDYWHQKFYFALMISIILSILLFLLVERRVNWPVLVGSILILSAFPLLKIKEFILFFIPDNLQIITIFLNIFFSKAYSTFWISFIVGLVLIGLGLGLKFSNAEFVQRIIEKIEKKPQTQLQGKDVKSGKGESEAKKEVVKKEAVKKKAIKKK